MDPAPTRPEMPAGTVSFLFTDIEGSTRLIQRLEGGYADLLADHRAILLAAIEGRGGRSFGSEGDAIFAAFTDAPSAIRAAADAQRGLAAHPWPDGAEIRVRMGIHTGDVVLAAGDYVGLALHQVARITSAGHGGQVLVSDAARILAESTLGPGLELRDLGSHRLKDLARPERIHQLVIDGLAAEFPPLRTLEARPNNLPIQVTSFVGRAELGRALELLGGTRLLTLTGPGGTGKTRLALALAAEVLDEYPDGVFFVALDAVTDGTLVPLAIAAALGVEMADRPPVDVLVDHLRDRRALLVLDNFEQVMDAAPVVSRLLREAPAVRIVVTSRIVLRAYGEQELGVPPLGLPEGTPRSVEEAARSEAVMLFVERAMASQASFRLTDENAAIVADIVTRLDGLPLAIELAAARVRILPVAALQARLDQRLAALTGGARDLPARQQTLRGAIDWSYDLLDEADRRLFERFAIFAGGACLTQAEAVCGPADELGRDVLDGLASLAEKSLIRTLPPSEVEPRFGMLATIREYALERLEASPDAGAERIRSRHASAYLELADAAAPELTGRNGGRWLDRLEVDIDNFRAALDGACAAGRPDVAARFVVALWRFWQIRGHLHEARLRIDRVVGLPGVEELSSIERAGLFGAAGSIAYWQGDFARAHADYSRALEAARESGDDATIAEALYNFGFSAEGRELSQEERFGLGQPYIAEALDIYRRIDDMRGIAGAVWALALGELVTGDNDAARTHLLESLEQYRRLDDLFGAGWAHHLLGLLDLNLGDPDTAAENFRSALDLFTESGDQSGILLVLADMCLVALRRGDRERHWRLAGACAVLREATGTDLVAAPIATLGWTVPEGPEDDPDSRRWWDEGRAMSVDAAAAYARDGVLAASTPDRTDGGIGVQ